MLKGFLTWNGRAFRKTHNLIELGEQCAQIDPSLEPPLRKAAPLTEYAWKYRYPGEPEPPTREEVELALAVARAVRDAVLEWSPDEVRF